jgi:hypothetical protein
MRIFFQGRAALLRGLDFWRRGSAALPVVIGLLATLGAVAQTTNGLSDAEIQGRKLAQQLCDAQPTTNLFQNGTLEIRDGHSNRTNFSIRFEVIVTKTDWQSIYTHIVSDTPTLKDLDTIKVIHLASQQNQYEGTHFFDVISSGVHEPRAYGRWTISSEQLITPFAESDFWICDLGLEFFHWPGQKIVKKENRRGRGCMVLESTNPDPSTNGYSRVVSWIDEESGGIVQAEAYDFKNKLLKEFAPKSFKKVNGQWELQDMEIDNVQTGSRTRISFDLKPK